MRAFESVSDVELKLIANNLDVDYDCRIEAAKEIYRRAGEADGKGLHKPDGRYI
ncbi:hypothetical protein MF628_000942 [Paenibacillus polymyxa]|uniref:hypothetical protein n=1 Tax=Paenibacillus polymyxa TaxID=1406 RepID=UPI00202471DF|nr:hypothetical protein [Paenibacillus polymyxa]URJ46412.3 hypothetical protein MF628_000942 [Paenibacillus polymyxa]